LDGILRYIKEITGACPSQLTIVFMNLMFSDEKGHSTDNVPTWQHDDDDHLPQILQDLKGTNIHDHATTTSGDPPCPDLTPTHH
jgi:hypothetical protein